MSAPVLACLLSALLFGASTPLSKALLAGIGPFTLAGLLYLGAALAVAPFSAAGGSRELRHTAGQRTRLGGAVLFGGILGPVLLLVGLLRAPAASVSLWLNGEVIATALLGWAFFGDSVGRRGLVGVGLALVAGLLLALPGGAAGLEAGGYVTLACVCWALDNNLTATVCGFTPAQTTLAKGLVAGTVNLALGLALERPSAGLPVVLGALVLGGLAYGLSIVLYIMGAHQLGAARAQLLFATGPFLGVGLAWLVLGESVEPVQLMAFPLMAAGLVVLLSGRHEHAHEHAAASHTHRHRHDEEHHGHEHVPPVTGWHTHPHEHAPLRHAHAHVPDLHHRHGHS